MSYRYIQRMFFRREFTRMTISPELFYITALFTAVLSLLSCNEPKNPKNAQDLNLKVTYSSGDDFFYQDGDSVRYFAPYPFNVGIFQGESQEVEVMLIAKRINAGSSVEFIPVAKMSMIEPPSVQKDIFVAIPKNRDLRISDGESFYDFTVNQFSYKQLVEFWYSNRYGLQGTSLEGWSPTSVEFFKAL